MYTMYLRSVVVWKKIPSVASRTSAPKEYELSPA
jgi:hypothetical protein